MNHVTFFKSLLKKIEFPLLFMAVFHSSANAQIAYPGTPAAIKYGLETTSLHVNYAPLMGDVETLKMQDELNQNEWGTPPKIAQAIPASFDLARNGEWTQLSDGSYVCRMRIRSEGALAIMFSYADFFIPEGAFLYIYNKDKTQILGAYTNRTNPKGGAFATEMIAGDDIIFEYNTSSKSQLPRVVVDELGYCYNNISLKQMKRKANLKVTDMDTELGESSYCMININCEEGLDWQTEKRGVARMVMYVSNGAGGAGWYLCSGTLVNNTKQDLTPYFLSAYHCYEGTDEEHDFQRWIFYFHYESPDCYDEEPEQSYTIIGCQLRTAIPIKNGSDGLLLELGQEIPEEWDVYYNGWDRRIDPIGGGVGIHHPAGDIKKISTFKEYSSSTWPGQTTGGDNAHWVFNFVKTENGISVTEGGSSGSPMFASNHLLVGTLTGGNSSCTNPSGSNYYGRFWFHWDQYGETPQTQMKYWLDPIDTGVESLKGTSYNPTAPRIVIDEQSLTFYSSELNIPGDIHQIEINTYNLTGNVTIKSDDNFAVSLDKSNWAKEVNLTNNGGSIYVAYKPLNVGNHEGKLIISSLELKQEMYVTLKASSCPAITLEQLVPIKGQINENYNFTFNAFNGKAPYTYELIDGKLPEGIILNEDGTLSGTIKEPGIFNFVMNVMDINGCSNAFKTSLYVMCNIIEVYPYQQSFDLMSEIPDCWLQENVKGDAKWGIQSREKNNYKYPQQALAGLNNAFFQSEDYEGKTTLLITPQLDLSTVKNPRLSFWHTQQRWYGDQDELRIYYKTSPFAEWILLKEFTEDIPEWKQFLIDLPEVTSEFFIGFQGKSNFGYGIGLDEISIYSQNDGSNIIENYFDDVKLDYSSIVEDIFSLSWTGDIESVQIIDVQGKTIVYKDNLLGLSQFQTYTSGWNPGIYIVKLRYEYATSIFKLIKK